MFFHLDPEDAIFAELRELLPSHGVTFELMEIGGRAAQPCVLGSDLFGEPVSGDARRRWELECNSLDIAKSNIFNTYYVHIPYSLLKLYLSLMLLVNVNPQLWPIRS